MVDPIFQFDGTYQMAQKLLDAAALRQEAIAANIANVFLAQPDAAGDETGASPLIGVVFFALWALAILAGWSAADRPGRGTACCSTSRACASPCRSPACNCWPA